MRVLVTGGMGYIGSHTCVQMIEAGMTPIIVDNLYNSKETVLGRINNLTGVTPAFYKGDIRDRKFLDSVFAENDIDAVIHFAGLKAVGESVEKPLEYYDNNVSGTLVLVEAMRAAGVNAIIFSSSATVYGDPASVPITEDFPTSATNPYGRSKLMVEECLGQGIPNNLMPFISQVAVGRREFLSVFGNDYPTVDGTGVRDYIHVVDLADGHLAALTHKGREAGLHIYNLGTGNGNSVLQMAKAFEIASGVEVPYKIAPRRAGDIAECWADPAKAKAELHWEAKLTLDDMTQDTWRWQSQNPNGYPDAE
jgi:UDP-glucose 4-epimerase